MLLEILEIHWIKWSIERMRIHKIVSICVQQAESRQTNVDVEGQDVNKYGLKQVFFQSIFCFWTLLELEVLELYGSDKPETINTSLHPNDWISRQSATPKTNVTATHSTILMSL